MQKSRHASTTSSPASSPPSSTQSTSSAETGLTFYPAYCNRASPTWFTWVKITAHDVHHVLQSRPGYTNTAGTNVRGGNEHHPPALPLFYLNHPIQFVQVVGVVVNFEDYFEKFWLFTLDDSSGATIDVTCRKPVVKKSEAANTQDMISAKTDHDSEEDRDLASLHALLPTLAIGTVVQAKGTVTTFRSTRQLHLIRLSLVRTSTDELQLISSRTKFLASTLSKPWVVPPSVQTRLLKEAQGEIENQSARAKRYQLRQVKKRAWESRHAREIAEEYAREEAERHKAAEMARRAGEALKQKWNRREKQRAGDGNLDVLTSK